MEPIYNDTLCNQQASKHFRYFGLGSLIYAIFFTLCLYRNNSGITYPFFVGGTLFYFFLSLKKLKITIKKDSAFYIISILLLGISTFLTDDGHILFLNKIGIFVLMFSFMIHGFHDDTNWNLGRYLLAIFKTILGTFAVLGRPFSDGKQYIASLKNEEGNKSKNFVYIFMGLCIAFPLIIVIFILLTTADPVFSYLLFDLLGELTLPENPILIIVMIVFSFLSSYCILIRLQKKALPEEVANKQTGQPILAITVTSFLAIIYLIFSFIQIVYLFMGNATLPNEYTYSEYARQGFYQLLFVCLINLTIVLICITRFKENLVLKIILTIISLCTIVIIASSAMRMLICIQYYYLTFLRIFVLWALFVIFLILCGIICNIYANKFPLFKYSMVIVTLLYIGLSFSHPDYFIAKYNISATKYLSGELSAHSGFSDFDYLKSLSADAAPAYLGVDNLWIKETLSFSDDKYYVENYYRCRDAYAEKIAHKASNSSFFKFNLSRYIATKYL